MGSHRDRKPRVGLRPLKCTITHMRTHKHTIYERREVGSTEEPRLMSSDLHMCVYAPSKKLQQLLSCLHRKTCCGNNLHSLALPTGVGLGQSA